MDNDEEREAVLLGLPAEHDWTPETLAELYEKSYAPHLTDRGLPTAERAADVLLSAIETNPLSSLLLADFTAYAIGRFVSEAEDPKKADLVAAYSVSVDAFTFAIAGYSGPVVTMLRLDAYQQGDIRSQVFTDVTMTLAARNARDIF